jgi:histone acetyltransferase (RNA polymerase elongator complex component)
MSIVPPWTRVNRVHRDFPEAQEKNNYLGFVSENIRSNLQQMVMAELKKHGQVCMGVRWAHMSCEGLTKNRRARLCACVAHGETTIPSDMDVPFGLCKCCSL